MMKVIPIVLGILCCFAGPAFSQSVGIGTLAPSNTAALDISSTSKGLLIPRLTTAQRDAIVNPASGLMIYNNTDNEFNFYNGGRWQHVNSMPKGAILLSEKELDSTIIREGFTPEGFLTQDYLKQVYGDTTIPAFNWYLGNRLEYQNSSAPYSKFLAEMAGSSLFVFDYGRTTGPSMISYAPILKIFNRVTDKWATREIPDAFKSIVADAVENGSLVWSGTEFLLWGGGNRPTAYFSCGSPANPRTCYVYGSLVNSGVRYNPVTNTWAILSSINAPAARFNHKAVWTGTEMIIWGGRKSNGDSLANFFNTGAKYNPATDSWTVMTAAPSFEGRQHFVMKQAGTKVIIWGGNSKETVTRNIVSPCNGSTVSIVIDSVINHNNGLVYNPAANNWTTMSTVNAPIGRYGATAEWYVDRLVIAGGTNSSHNISCGLCGSPFPSPCVKISYQDSVLNTGASYYPATNTWVPVPPAPKHFSFASSFSDGDQYFWIFGQDSTLLFEPSANDWFVNGQSPLPAFTNELQRKLVWQTGTSTFNGGDKLALPGTAHPAGKLAVYVYSVSPTTISELKSSGTVTGAKFYLYKKE